MEPHIVPDSRIRVNGSAIPAAAEILSVRVLQDLNASSMCELKLLNWDHERLHVVWSDNNTFQLGAEIRVDMGYVDELETVFNGEVVGLEPEWSAEAAPTIVIRAFDRLHRLARGRKTRTFVKMTDSEIISKIATEAGLRGQVTDSKIQHEHVYQHNQSDLEFIRERAARLGFEVFVDNKTLVARPQGNTAEASQTLTLGHHLYSFRARVVGSPVPASIETRGWDQKQKKEIVGKASSPQANMGRTVGPAASKRAFGQSTLGVTDWPVSSKAEADRLSGGVLDTLALNYVEAEASGYGQSALKAGTVVRIDGAGGRFSGLYYVRSAEHTLDTASGYQTSLNLRRNAT